MSQWHVVERGKARIDVDKLTDDVCTGDRLARLARDLAATKSVWLDRLVAALICRFFTSGFRCAARRGDLSMTMKLFLSYEPLAIDCRRALGLSLLLRAVHSR